MSSDDAIPKICPSCRGKDVTSFSSCRFCGTKYDATNVVKISDPNLNIASNLAIVGLIGMLIATFVWFNAINQHQRAEVMKPLSATIKASNRPRVLEFYADWCGPCRAYGPVVEAAQAKYSDKIDFQRLNVDDPKSQELAAMCGVSSIPRTCIFDKDGKSVADFSGGVSADRLDQYMQQALSN